MRLWIVLLSVLMSSGCKPRNATVLSETDNLNNTDPSEEWSIDDLMVRANNAIDVGDFIKNLPPVYRENFVLMFHSGSEQPATPQEPRVIMFGRTATVAIAFSGVLSSPASKVVQFLAINPLTNKVTPYSFDFGAAQRQAAVDTCIHCHNGAGGEIVHIWNSYAFWPGSYGGIDDRIATNDHDRSEFLDKPIDGRMSVNSLLKAAVTDDDREKLTPFLTEDTLYSAWLEARKKHPYYQHLIIPPNADGKTLGSYLVGYGTRLFKYEPNARFGYLLGRWNARRLHRYMKSSTTVAYEVYRPQILFSLLDCQFAAPDFGAHDVPKIPAVRQAEAAEFALAYIKAAEPVFSKTLSASSLQDYKSTVEFMEAKLKESNYLAPRLHAARLMKLWAEALGIEKDRFMAFNDGSGAKEEDLLVSVALNEYPLFKEHPMLNAKSMSNLYKTAPDEPVYMEPADIAAIDGIAKATVAPYKSNKPYARRDKEVLCKVLRDSALDAL